MTIAFSCPQCGKGFDVDGALAGKRCRCKQCGHLFSIPIPKTPRATIQGRSEAPIRRKSAARRDAPDDPFGIEEQPLPPRRSPAPEAEEPEWLSRDQIENDRPRKPLRNPWLTIWYSPRKTLRRIVKKDAEQGVMLLLFLAGVNQTLSNFWFERLPVNLTIFHVFLLLLLGATIYTALSYFLGAGILRLAGHVLGGDGESEEMRAAPAWAEVPMVAILVLRGAAILVMGTDALEPPGADMSLRLIIDLASIPLYVWSFVLLVACVAEAHRFSIAKAVGALVVAVLVLMAVYVGLIVVGFIVFFRPA